MHVWMKIFAFAFKINSPPASNLDHPFQLWSLHSTKLLLKSLAPLATGPAERLWDQTREALGPPALAGSRERVLPRVSGNLGALRRGAHLRCGCWNSHGQALWRTSVQPYFTCLAPNPQQCLPSLVTQTTWFNFKTWSNFKAGLVFSVRLSHKPSTGP